VTLEDLQQRSTAMAGGNVKRLTRYLDMQKPTTELAFSDALSRMYENDRVLANPVRIDTALPESQATRLFAKSAQPNAWADAQATLPLLTRPANLEGPAAILSVVDILSGKRDAPASDSLLAEGFRLHIDGVVLQGAPPWAAWVAFLRDSPKLTALELVAGALAKAGSLWVLTCQWQGVKDGQALASPPFTLSFEMTDGRLAAIQTQRADYAFVVGNFILPRVAFAALLGQLVAKVAA
jgi:hypothetical protein